MWTVADLIKRLQQEDPAALVVTLAGPMEGGLGFRGLLHMERTEVIQNHGWRKRKNEGEYIGIEESKAGKKTRAKRFNAFFIG